MFLDFVFKSLKGLYGADMYQVYLGAHETSLNSQGGLAVPLARTNFYMKSIRASAAARWKSFPVFIRQFDNYNSFNIILKHYLMCRVL